MRRGVIESFLSVVIALVMVMVVFASAFYLYQTFTSTMTSSDAVTNFEKFLKPIQAACNGKNTIVTDLSLPINTPYTYSIVQTRLRDSDSNTDPIMKGSCIDSYCLCLLRMEKDENYNIWKTKSDFKLLTFFTEFLENAVFSRLLPAIKTQGSTNIDYTKEIDVPAPLWHFNTPGISFFPLFLMKSVGLKLLDIVVRLLLPRLITFIVAQLGCCAVTAGFGCFLCFVAAYAITTAVVEATWEFVFTFLKEVLEPILVVNFPSNFMTTNDPEHLYWQNPSKTFSCDINAQWGPEELRSDLEQAVLASSEAFIKGLIKGAVSGLAVGLSNVIGAALSSSASSRLAKLAVRHPTLANFLLKSTQKTVAGAVYAAGYTMYGLTLYEKMTRYGVIIDAVRNEVSTPSNLRPQCNILDLLSARRSMDLNAWILLGKYFPAEATYEPSVYNMETLDVLSCVSIDDLGPLCNEDTKIILDYDTDFIYYYKLTDPINDPIKSVFCDYSQASRDYEAQLGDFLVAIVESIPLINTIPESIIQGLSQIISQVFLAGITNIGGLLMECGYPSYIINSRAEYFQYWTPYYDSQSIIGYDGQIPMLEANYIKNDNPTQCIDNAVKKWDECYDNARTCFGDCKQCHDDCEITDVTGTTDPFKDCCKRTTCDYERCCVENDFCVYNDCDLFDKDGNSLEYPEGTSSWVEYFGDLKNMVNGAFNQGKTPADFMKPKCDPCYQKHYRELLKCINGVHITPSGVII